MYSKIMVPIDLTHVERLNKAIDTATDLAKHYGVPIVFAGVTAETPTETGHNPAEYAEKLKAYGAEQAKEHGVGIETEAVSSTDPAVDINDKLIAVAKDKGADLIVMASHVPGLPDHIFTSHAGSVASYSDASVFVVR